MLVSRDKKWDYAIGMIKVDGLEPTPEMRELIDPYLYPDSAVLKNLLDIRNSKKLQQAESFQTLATGASRNTFTIS